jgi:hypothetical protein
MMDKIGDLFGKHAKPPKKTRRTERSDLYDQILTRLNPGRQKAGYKPITPARLAYLLTGIPTKDLYALVSRCDDAERRGFPPGAIKFAQGRYEMGKVQWRRLFFNDVAGSIVGSSIGFFIGFLVAYWFINL